MNEAVIPDAWRDEWAREIARRPDEAAAAGRSAPQLLFRVGAEWYSIPVESVLEIGPVPAIHSLPHRSGIVRGVVNVRGRITACISLEALLAPLPSAALPSAARLVVFQRLAWLCAARVDGVEAVKHAPVEVAPLPPPHDAAASRVIAGLWTNSGRTVASLDPGQFFSAIQEAMA